MNHSTIQPDPNPADQPGMIPVWSPIADVSSTSTTALADAPSANDLGERLLAQGTIDQAQITAARNVQSNTPGKPLATILREAGVDDHAIQQAVAAIHQLQLVEVDVDDMDAAKFANQLGLGYCEAHGLLPLKLERDRLTVGMVQPDDLLTVDELRHRFGVSIRVVVIAPSDIEQFIASRKEEDSGEASMQVDEIIAGMDEDDIEVVESAEESAELDLERMAGESPVIRLVNYVIFNAVKEGASDIHIEPMEKRLQIRYRIDGILFDAMNPPNHMSAAIISRLKVMANLDISERRLPQDGRIRANVHGRKLDLRMNTLPMAGGGEKCVLRILDTRSIQVELDDLGMGEDTLTIWKNQVQNPHGIILVTGPTGSGKTTTLYSSLGQMDRNKLNISTVEDPVEYHLDGINQTQVMDKIGMSFSAALRALLRQDPDVIMLGEIRDAETARIGIQASLTGHLVLSTLHTNDAPSAVTRLINIGVEPYLISSAVNAVLAQRLCRRICQKCKVQVEPDEHTAEHLAMHGITVGEVWKGEGCDKCRGTGYSGRVGLYELLVLDDNLRDRITGNPNVTEFRRICIERGMKTLRQDGFEKVAKGETTVDEVLRVTEATI